MRRVKEIKVFFKDKGKVEEIIKFLLKNSIGFTLKNAQEFVLYSEKDYEELASDGRFRPEKVDKFPSEIKPRKYKVHIFEGEVGEIEGTTHVDCFDQYKLDDHFALEYKFEKWLEQFAGKKVKVIVVVKE